MATKDFRTKTIFIPRENFTRNDGVWPIALDIGYSGVKGMSPNSIFSFPCFVKKTKDTDIVLGNPAAKDILYRDCQTGNVYIVGARAQDVASAKSSDETNSALYGRNRYYSENFIICSKVGMGFAMLKNKFGNPEGKKVILQTGLPPQYLVDDTFLLKDVLSGRHCFDLKIGNSDWRHFDITLEKDDIRVIQQPMGTLLSITTQNNGKFTSDAKKILSSKVIVLDPGFGTLDTTFINAREIDIEDCLTFDDLGMKQVLQNTCDTLRKDYNVSLKVSAIQPYLEKGYVNVFDRAARKSSNLEFESILRNESKKVCLEALHQLGTVYNDFIKVDYIVLAGGLIGDWASTIKDYFKDMETIRIIPGVRNDELPYIFSNVRGYYMHLAMSV